MSCGSTADSETVPGVICGWPIQSGGPSGIAGEAAEVGGAAACDALSGEVGGGVGVFAASDFLLHPAGSTQARIRKIASG